MSRTFIPTAASVFERLPRVLRRHRLFTAWMSLTNEDPIQLVRIRDSFYGYADMRDGFLRLVVIDGDFERDFFALADAFLAEGGVFLDIGANYGLLSCGLAGRHANKVRFHLFEPNAALIDVMRRSLALYPTVEFTLNCTAVSDRVGFVAFLVNKHQTGASHIEDGVGEKVPSVTIDHYLHQVGIGQVELLKMDIEGYELSAMRGAQGSLAKRTIQALYFEYFAKYLVRVAPPGELLKYLDDLEYEVCFCRKYDLRSSGGASHSIRSGFPGHGIPLRPVKGHCIPAMTDLLAVPKENLESLG